MQYVKRAPGRSLPQTLLGMTVPQPDIKVLHDLPFWSIFQSVPLLQVSVYDELD